MDKAFSSLKLKGTIKPRVDNFVFRLHYRYTFILFMGGAILSTLYDFVGKKIICMVDTLEESLKSVVESYCYITGTYTVDKLQYGQVGVDFPHQGVGPHTAEDSITYHKYYQWVPFVLVAQGCLFYLPHLLWKKAEGGLFKGIIQNLSLRDYLGRDGKSIANYFNKEKEFQTLSVFIREHMHTHKKWAAKFVFYEFMNVIVTVFTIFFTNYFLGGEFLTYGTEVFAISDMDPENRTDPMAQVFPRMGKCTFRMYGPSGTIEKRDVMCLLPTNIANEKIYMFLWFWLVILGILGGFWLIWRFILFIKSARELVFLFRVYRMPRYYSDSYAELEEHLAKRDEVKAVLAKCDLGDYILLSQLGDNMESSIFSEFIKTLSRDILSDEEKRHSMQDSGLDEDNHPDETTRLKKPDAFKGDSVYPPISVYQTTYA